MRQQDSPVLFILRYKQHGDPIDTQESEVIIPLRGLQARWAVVATAGEEREMRVHEMRDASGKG